MGKITLELDLDLTALRFSLYNSEMTLGRIFLYTDEQVIEKVERNVTTYLKTKYTHAMHDIAENASNDLLDEFAAFLQERNTPTPEPEPELVVTPRE